MAIVEREAGAVWLRVADVAAVLGVSANTVRRWTDAGRIAAHRSPGGHRRYLADDVYALLPADEGDGTAQPGDFAELRRQTQDLRAVAAGRPGPDVAARRGAARRAGRGGARAVRPHRRAALRRLPRRRRASAARRRPWTAASSTRAQRRRVGHAPSGCRWSGDPAAAPVTCVRATDGRPHAARAGWPCSAAAAARSPGRRWCCAASSSAPSSSATPATATSRAHADVLEGLARDLRRGGRHRAHDRGARAPRQERARAGRPLARGGADARLRARSSCASRSGCSRPPTPTASTCGASAAA